MGTAVKKRPSGFLDPDFSIEDINAGFYGKTNRQSKSGIDLVNKMGLLGCLNDIHNTDPTNFAIESARLLGESELFGNFVNQGLQEINHTYQTLTTIKERYAVEGLDPYKFGQESGIGDMLKKAWNAIVVAFKRLVQALMNWVRSVANFIGSQIARSQEKYIELYEELDDKEKTNMKAKKIKAVMPLNGWTGLFQVRDHMKTAITNMTDGFDMLAQFIDKCTEGIIETPNGTVDMSANDAGAALKLDGAIKNLEKKFDSNKMMSKKKNGLSSNSAVLKEVYGKDKPVPKETAPAMILKSFSVKLLSKDQVTAQTNIVKEVQKLVKTLNTSIKLSIKAASSAEKFFKGEKGGAKAKKSQAANRKALKTLAWERNIAGYMNGMIISWFSVYLRTRGYVAAAVKSLVAASKKD